MAPTLGKAGKRIGDKMAIGKVDCTRQKRVCNRYEIRGYPTLKYFLDGQVYDYLGNHDEESIIAFADRMTSPPITRVTTMEEAIELAKSRYDQGIAFVGTDQDVQSREESKLYSIFETVARNMQASANFIWLENVDTPDQPLHGQSNSEFAATSYVPSSVFVQRLEPREAVVRNWEITDERTTTVESLQAWVQDHNVPIFVTFSGDNFARINNRGRPLFMALVDTDYTEQLAKIKSHMMEYIVSHTFEEVDQYYFGVFDSKLTKYLQQFGVQAEDNPQFLILDSDKGVFWRNETYTTITDFMTAVKDGSIVAKKKDRDQIGETGLHWIAELFMDYYPLSLGGVMVAICLLVMLVTTPPTERKPFEELKIAIEEGNRKAKEKLNKARLEVIGSSEVATTAVQEDDGGKWSLPVKDEAKKQK
jgi:hypothetical protein